MEAEDGVTEFLKIELINKTEYNPERYYLTLLRYSVKFNKRFRVFSSIKF